MNGRANEEDPHTLAAPERGVGQTGDNERYHFKKRWD
jgi:hypothetical protein